MADIPAMRAVLAQIEAHPETWDQSTWRCQTGMCFAGWAAELSPDIQWTLGADAVSDESYHDAEVTFDGCRTHVSFAAESVLGLSQDQADLLFASGNTLDEIKTIVDAIEENPAISYDRLVHLLGWE